MPIPVLSVDISMTRGREILATELTLAPSSKMFLQTGCVQFAGPPKMNLRHRNFALSIVAANNSQLRCLDSP